jgi:hypothetical protein
MRHEFVDLVPEVLEEGVLYVCVAHATVVHRCCCGCGNEVVTPLDPKGWSVTYDGRSVSLSPSIGNWSFPCQSHYWIRRDRVQEARRFSAREIAAVRGGAMRGDAEDAWASVRSETPAPSSPHSPRARVRAAMQRLASLLGRASRR